MPDINTLASRLDAEFSAWQGKTIYFICHETHAEFAKQNKIAVG